jgi:hypothetical protein
VSVPFDACFNPGFARGQGNNAPLNGRSGMDYDVWIAQDNIRRYREILGHERNVAARAKLEGLIMAEEDKLAHLRQDDSEMQDRVAGGQN